MNVIMQLRFELVYGNVTIQYISHYAKKSNDDYVIKIVLFLGYFFFDKYIFNGSIYENFFVLQ